MKRKWVVVNVFVLVVLVFVLAGLIWSFSINVVEPEEECIDVNNVASFIYGGCYDAYSKNIFLEVRRSQDYYLVNSLGISFFDFTNRVFDLMDVPEIDGSRAYKISAEKNPENLYVSLNIKKDFSASVCEEPRRISIGYCPARLDEESVNVSIDSDEAIAIADFIEVGKVQVQDSDVLDLNLVERERIWESQCDSRWDCSEWEACVDGVQKRSCKDVSKCFVSTDVPATVRYCGVECVESWECEWSSCKNGFSVPSCVDSNNCGTSYNEPQELKCGGDSECVVDVVCEDWSSCEVDYNFEDLVGGFSGEIEGVRSRVCVDENKCVGSQKYEEVCSVGVDIYTEKFRKCGEDFVGIYNSLNGEMIAKIREGAVGSSLNIYLEGYGEEGYCDYCFNGKKDGDEEGVDCGGGCKDCGEKYEAILFEKESWMRNLGNWIKGLFR